MVQHRFHVDQPSAQVVGALQDDVDSRGVDGPFGIARPVQDGFHFVGEFLDLPQFQKAGEPLYGVEAAENRVQGLAIGGFAFQGEHLGLDIDQVLPALDDKIRYQLRIPGKSACCDGNFLCRRLQGDLKARHALLQYDGDRARGSLAGDFGQGSQRVPKDSRGSDHRGRHVHGSAAAEIFSSTGIQADAFTLVLRLPDDQLESHVFNLLPQLARLIHSETFQKLFRCHPGETLRGSVTSRHRHRCSTLGWTVLCKECPTL